MANFKYLIEFYGERLRKNPTWTVKKMQEAMLEELEFEVPRIKIMRIRKAAMDKVHDNSRNIVQRSGSLVMKFYFPILETHGK